MHDELPHERVYARIGVSKIHGIGVIAICDIPKGTNIFSNDQLGVRWCDQAQIDKSVSSDPEHRRLYNDFCILKEGKYGCPINFNSISVGWYLNEPRPADEPNVYANDNYDFFAKRDIKAGEELTTIYSAFSEVMKRY